MTYLFRPLIALLIALSLAACAAQSQQYTDIQPPPKKQLDAKTQLESGRKY